jgi:23S rRNA (adenine2503-C2)-methyltransferase
VGTSLADLKDALDSYYRVSTRRPSIEYLMMKGINDGEKDLAALLDFCDGLFVHVNLLPMNEIEGSPFHPSRSTVVDHWVRTLTRNGIEANVRDSRGSDIDGACGQLKNRLG